MNSLYCALLDLYNWYRGGAVDAVDPGSFFEDIRPHSEYA